MTEAKGSEESLVKLLYDLFNRVEKEQRWVRAFSIFTMVVSAWMAISYLWLLSLPILFDIKTVTVNLTDYLHLGEILLVMTVAITWFYLALRQYLFSRRWDMRFRRLKEFENHLREEVIGRGEHRHQSQGGRRRRS